MNTNIADSRVLFPVFFEDWDKDPYETFLKVLGFHSYGFPDLGRDDYRVILQIMLDGLGIDEYWNPKLFNPENREFCEQMDSCFATFIKEYPLEEKNAHKWFIFLKTLSYGFWPHPLLAEWVSKNLAIFKEFERFDHLSNSLKDAFEQAAFAVVSRHSNKYPHVTRWVLNRIRLYPHSYRYEILRIFRQEDKRYASGLFEFLPSVLMAHRRKLHQQLKDNRDLVKRFPKYRRDPRYGVDELNRSLKLYLTGIFWAQEMGENLHDRDHPGQKEAHQKASEWAEKMIIEHAARCPFPAV